MGAVWGSCSPSAFPDARDHLQKGFFLPEKMDNLYYSPSEGMTFWIAGYRSDRDGNVSDIVNQLSDDAAKFAAALGISAKLVNTFTITKSSLYRNMRMYYAITGSAPTGAKVLSDGDNMRSFIEW